MRNIGKLVALDWKRIVKSPFAFLLIAALVIIPSLYCWFNVWALWDPYSNTQDLTVAVYSADQPATFRDQKIAVGDELMDQLKHNKQLGWRFVDSKKAVQEGVKSGKYYAGVVVPKHFSTDLLSFVDGKIHKPKLDYYVNEKINAIAPKITSTGASTLQNTISDEFVATVAKTLVKTFNKAGIKLDQNLPMIRRFASLVTNTNDQLPTIEKYLTEVDDLQGKMPAIRAKLQTANEIAEYLPEVNQMAQKLTAANGYLPLVQDSGELATDVKGKLPEVQQAGAQLNTVVTNFDQLESGVSQAVKVTDQGITVINQVDGTLPALTDFGQKAQAAVGTTKDEVLPKISTALDVVQNATDAGLTLIAAANTSLSADLTTLQNQLQQLDNSQDTAAVKQAMAERLTALAKRQGKVADNATSLAEMLERVQASLNKLTGKDNQILAGAIAQLKEVAAMATAVKDGAEALAKDVPNLSTSEIQARLGALAKTADQFAAAADALKALDIGTSVKQVLSDFKAALEDASTTLATINNQILPELPSLLSGTKDLLTQAHSFLVKAQQQLPALKQELTDANTLLNGHMNLITSGVTTVADLYQNDFPSLKAKLTKATDFINQDLPGIEKDLTNTLALANEKMPQLQSGLDDAHTFIKNDWPTLKDAIQKGAAAIKKGEKSVDLSQLIKLLRRDATKEAGFLAKPVELKQQSFYAIPTYGSQSAPFYLALCIWVGALLLGAILITEYQLPATLSDATVKQMYVARWLTFVGLGMLQGLIAALGNLFLIGTYVVDKPLYLLFSMMLSVVFVSILYMLISLFGNIGKGIGIIILVLSISGAGGNFPVVLSGKFFQMINPWLPFTYAVNLLRETVGGIYWPNLWLDLAVLAAFGISFFLVGLFLKEPIHPWIEKMHSITRRSKIIE
ncbi:YhgE/Pip domain-containing protein [Lacticaseibacillus zeae]|uniref:YhgE/Pip domain-containing protein n=1 Tax=Lacticaseibacillus zeae subsp. silagei TaxID=3068307 RepID=A0ABD7Z7C0_LACZE|nr:MULTISPECIES: YhgE/Pip domain-containing protein [Lacticaseibacillus]MDE3315780.1 YhgE/Pip domain-containing protein [Lacticaseibacillus zeae]OFR91607.1 phage infection protein [Lactobacillus sp. HMSC068F07]WLV82830.1 YhgE/Pip domain-containing protein [Lacticaseibacillus sp. NCIMB 15475]WLV85571.1 YhgE/Pip domain-containing protein [Lacticaseibacillus sp. NCIMB 15474]